MSVATHLDLTTDGTLVVERVQDCVPIAEACAELRQADMTGSHDWKHAAEIPMVIIERYMNDRGIDLQEFMRNPAHIRAVCNDSSLSAFRIWPGRL